MGTNRHGRYSSSDQGLATAAAGTAIAAVLDPFPTNGWVDEIWIHVGDYTPVSGTPTVRASVYDTASSAPDDKVADTDRFTPAAGMSTGAGGDLYRSLINWTGGGSGSPAPTALKARSGVRYAIAVNVQGSGQLAIGMLFAANATNENKYVFRHYGVSSTPPSVFVVSDSSYEGQLSFALGYTPNRAPTATYTGATGTITTATPSISASFVDADTVYGDRMTAYGIQVRRKDTGALVWNPGEFIANGTEKTNGAFTQPYAGTPLVPGVTYQVIVRVADEFGTYSTWTYNGAPEFTYSSGPEVVATGPTGKQTNVSTMTFAGNYYHENLLAGNAVKVRIKRNGAIYYESDTIAKAIAAPGSAATPVAFTITQASLSPALGTLPSGSTYTLEIMARDSANAWGGYSDPITFTSNARPNVPTGLSPSNNSVVTSYPLVYFFASDSDDVPPTLTAELRIKDSDHDVLFTRTATWNSSKSRFEYQVTGTDFAGYGEFYLDARAYDGNLYSDYAPEAKVTYAAGPVPDWVAPVDGGTLLTTRPTLSWTLTSGDQAQYKIEIRTAAEGYGTEEPALGWDEHIWDTGWITSLTDDDYQITADVLDNETWYQAVLTIKNGVGLEGSTVANFYVEFPPVRQITGFAATLTPGRFDAPNQASQVLLTWEPTDYPPSQFEEYRVTKRLSSETPGQARTIFRTSSPNDTRFLDDNVRGRQEYIYAVRQTVTRDGEAAHSARVEASAIVTFRSIIINDAVYSGDFRVVIRQWTTTEVDNSTNGQERVPWGAQKPIVMFGSENYDIPTITAQFIDDEYGMALDYYQALNELRDNKRPVMVRLPNGIYWFCTIKSVRWDLSSSGMLVATISLVQNNYTEGSIL